MKHSTSKRNRRSFLKSSLSGIAAAALTSCTGGNEEVLQNRDGKPDRKPAQEKKKYPIVTRTLGRTGIEMPVISMGACAEDRAVYEAALDAGIRYIDTDATYRRGRHERMVGEIIKERPRESVMVSTRINLPCDTRWGYPEGTRGDGLLKLCEKSMKRLGVDLLDLLSLHSVSSVSAVTYRPILETLQKIKREGQTRFLGVTVHGYEPDVIRAAVDCGVYDVITTSYNFKQRHAAEVKEAIAYAAHAGLGIIAMKTQAGAFLDRERTKPVNHKAAIKWVLSDMNVHTAIPGFRNFEEMELFLSVMEDLTLTPEEQLDLDSAKRMAGLYCQYCGQCVPQCPHGIFVPSYMRAYMYAYGYQKPGKAKETIADSAMKNLPCRDCSSCSVSCVMGFDVKDRILDIARVWNIPEDFLQV